MKLAKRTAPVHVSTYIIVTSWVLRAVFACFVRLDCASPSKHRIKSLLPVGNFVW